MNEIAVIHAGAIGDLVQTLPTLRAVRARWPAAHVTFVGHPARATLALLAGACDAWTDLETCGLAALLGDAACHGEAQRSQAAPRPPLLARADLVLDFLTRGALEARAGDPGAPRVVSLAPLPPEGWARPAAAWIFEEAARHLDLPDVPLAPEIGVAHDILETGRRLLGERGVEGRFVAIHPGSGSARKNWPPDRFAEVAGRVRREAGRAVAWLLGPAERERGPAPTVGPGDAVLADLPRDRVALFGPTDARVWAPQGPHVRVIRSPDGTLGALGEPEVWNALAAALK
jgi:hypothetical protein